MASHATVDLARLKKEHVFAAQGTAQELLGHLAQIEQTVAQQKKLRRILRFIGLAVVLASIAASFLLASYWFWLGLILAVAIWIWSAFQGADLVGHENRVRFVDGLLRKLADDSGSNPFTIALTLKNARQQLSSKKTARQKGTETLYKAPWLEVAGKLVDGTKYRESILDLIRERKWVNPRGKSKRKERILHAITVRLVYPPSRYRNLEPVAQKLKNTFRMPGDAIVKAFNPSEKALAVKAVARTPQALAAANESILLGAYRIMNLARREIAANQRPEGRA